MSRFSLSTLFAALALCCATSTIQPALKPDEQKVLEAAAQLQELKTQMRTALPQSVGTLIALLIIPRIEKLNVFARQNYLTHTCVRFALNFINNTLVDKFSPPPHKSYTMRAAHTALSVVTSLVTTKLLSKLKTQSKFLNWALPYAVPFVIDIISISIMDMLSKKTVTEPLQATSGA